MDNLFPIAQRIQSKIIGIELVSVQPLATPNYYPYWRNIVYDRKSKIDRIFKSPEWRQHKIEELLK